MDLINFREVLLTSVKVFIVNILHHLFIVPVQTSLHW